MKIEFTKKYDSDDELKPKQKEQDEIKLTDMQITDEDLVPLDLFFFLGLSNIHFSPLCLVSPSGHFDILLYNPPHCGVRPPFTKPRNPSPKTCKRKNTHPYQTNPILYLDK